MKQKNVSELTEKDLEEIYTPKKLEKVGAWSNGTYFNGLAFKESNYKNFKEQLGIDFAIDILIQIDDEFFYPFGERERYVKVVENVHDYLLKWNKNLYARIKELKDYVDKNKNTNYNTYSDQELIKAVKKFNLVNGKVMTFLWSYLYTAELVEEYILKEISDLKFEDVRPMYKISAEILNDKLLATKSDEDLKKLSEEYGWYKINLLREKPTTIEDLKEIKKTAKPSQEIKESANPLLKELQMFMWLKFERIDIFNYSLYWMAPLFSECLSRLGLENKYWDVIMPDELTNALKTKKLPKDLDTRFSHRGLFDYYNNIRHISLEEYKKFKEKFTFKEEKNIKELRGKASCLGNVKGKVKVVNTPDQITKVKEGDILVITETIVQHEPYMRKTKGMIVEMGGMLSHSAIFSREFNIPAIVGVKNATKILKDGDLVEVDANTGVVRKIE